MTIKAQYKILTLFFILLLSPSAFGQKQKSKVNLIHADKWNNNIKLGKNVQRFLGNVVAKHDSTLFYSDSAFLNSKTQDLTSYGNVRIKVSDTVNLYGDSLFYNGNTRLAHVYGDVRLIDPTTILTTNYLIYNRNNSVASYPDHGKIINKQNTLTSIMGDYNTKIKTFYFKDSVLLVNPKYTMTSDTLIYNTQTEIVTFAGPTTIVGKEDYIFAKEGWYNTITDESRLGEDAVVINKDNQIYGDSIVYNKSLGIGDIYKNAILKDTAHDLTVMGDYVNYLKNKGFAYATDSAVAIAVDKGDTLYLHADTLRLRYDTATRKVKKMLAYNDVRFFRNDFQGQCDSLVYSYKDSTIMLYKAPIMWTGKNQMTSPDSIRITMANNELDTLVMYNSPFMSSRDSLDNFNQVTGRLMIGYFHKNDLRKIKVFGNSQTIFFARNEDKQLFGINKTASSNMLIILNNNQLKSISYLNKPDGTMYPPTELSPADLVLVGFKWFGYMRPKNKQDIFIDPKDIPAPVLSKDIKEEEIPSTKPSETNKLIPQE
ncbi:MAG: OstA-like protein [Hyphomicrobiales bacterium]